MRKDNRGYVPKTASGEAIIIERRHDKVNNDKVNNSNPVNNMRVVVENNNQGSVDNKHAIYGGLDKETYFLRFNQPTTEEIRRAWAIRNAARADSTIDHVAISDWEYLQHAIVAKTNVQKALKRIRRMQAFKLRYGIVRDGCQADARRDVEALMLLHPGFFMSHSAFTPTNMPERKKKSKIQNQKKSRQKATSSKFLDASEDFHLENHYSAPFDPETEEEPESLPQLVCYQYKNFRAHSIKTEEAHAIQMRVIFYVLNACNANVAAIRGGLFLVAEARSIGWHNFSLNAEIRTSELVMDAYPTRLFRIDVLFATPTMRIFYALCRSLMSAKYQRLATLHSQADSRAFLERQNDVAGHAMPQDLGGMLSPEDFLGSVMRALEERYRNVEEFVL